MIPRPLLYKVLSFSRTQKYNGSLRGDGLFREKYNFSRNHKWYHVCSVMLRHDRVQKEESPRKRYPAVQIWKDITVKELANILNCETDVIISLIPRDMNKRNIKPTTKLEESNVVIDIARKCGKKCLIVRNPNLKQVEKKQKTVAQRQPPPKPENLVKRPPVVTIMGHVDHGKTTLLDSLRNTFVVDEEFGGITQHIGAFSVEIKPGEKITFIDTPGHSAFTAMRARGAEVTDIVVLVIAADDGIMEQTVESIKIANRACVPMIVAVNKIDKTNASSIDEIKKKLVFEGIQVEEQGGNVQLVPISALKKINLDLLTEVILLEADLMNLKGDPTGLVEGVVIESKVDPRGILATIIVKRGTLTKGKILIAGKSHARVRAMLDENGKEYKEALPSTPVQVLGWKEFPSAGDEVLEVNSEKEATAAIKVKQRIEAFKKQEEDYQVVQEKKATGSKMHKEFREKLLSLKTSDEKKKFIFETRNAKVENVDTGPLINLIVKGDVHGTLEVLLNIMRTYDQDEECKLLIIDASVGHITESDVELAELANAIIFAFNVNLHQNVKDLVKEKRIDVRHFNVLYKLIDDLKSEINSRILPIDAEEIHGEAEVLQHFSITVGKKKVPVAGSRCIKGQLKRDSLYKIIREDEVVYKGKLTSMKHLKNEVGTIKSKEECGLMFDSFSGEFKAGDKIICYEMIKVPQESTWDPGF